MNDLDYSAIEKALGVEPSSIAEMPEEIRAKMKTVLETIVVRTDEDRKELYNALDLLWQKGSVLITLEKVSKATGIPMVTLSNLDFREHIIDELCIVIPCGAVKEVCFGLLSTLLLWAVNCNAELAEGCLACVAEFGVGSKSACFDYDVGHGDYLSFLGFGFLFVCCDYIILCNIPIVKYNFREFLNFGNAQHK